MEWPIVSGCWILRAQVSALNLKMGEDYAVVYDLTMARFWFRNAPARQAVVRCLSQEPLGRILSDAELAEMGRCSKTGILVN
jgi:hypothetical protein